MSCYVIQLSNSLSHLGPSYPSTLVTGVHMSITLLHFYKTMIMVGLHITCIWVTLISSGPSWSWSYRRFSTTYAIIAYHYYSCELESPSWRGLLDTTLCGKFISVLRQVSFVFFIIFGFLFFHVRYDVKTMWIGFFSAVLQFFFLVFPVSVVFGVVFGRSLFVLFVLYVLIIVLSVLRCTSSDYPFDIFKLFRTS